MDANTDVNLLGGLFVEVVGVKLGLDLLGTAHGIDDGRELDEEAIPGGLNEVAMMLRHYLLDDLVMDVQ
ncbi:MAG TPA: hypothetical protein VKK81_08490 [Candidatus Binatia bacterium]|nr:hypothetical protein [Candidatus Binatia bacterium]